ncbi:hypothetical protein JW935_09925 [candidate division KSB1 bacterium]|nr:hypothetical protein [candidate division KSB1 bacterium]
MRLHKLAIIILALYSAGCQRPTQPLRVHPENPRYFLYQNRPAILVGSTEHYGAVLNLDFDFFPYFEELQKYGLNLTRTFTGVYCEHPEAFNITMNTLAPDSGKLICPWARSDVPGYYNGGNKFDLTRWDEAYFTRLRDFITQAGRRGVIVELVLFCTYYGDEQWNLSPLNSINNINHIGSEGRDAVLTLQDSALTKVQEEMVRKIVTELNGFDNLYYEICNEPYFESVTDEWQRHIAQVIKETERELPKKHLIARNIANNAARIEDPDPNVDIFNFHYAASAAVDWNYFLNKPIGDDETGFAGTHDEPYRLEGWNFFLSGGALYDHLDYSFTVQHENGTYKFPDSQPGGGGSALREQFKNMKTFVEGLDFIHMKPAQSVLKGGVPENLAGRLMADSGRVYAGYFYRKSDQVQNISLRWTGRITAPESGEYIFYPFTDDGVRLWIDGKLLVDDWTSHAPKENSGRVFMTAGKTVDFRMDYFQGAGGAVADLFWQGPGLEKGEIAQQYFPQKEGGGGLLLEWFDDTELQNFKAKTVVKNISFNGSLDLFFLSSKATEKLSPVLDVPAGRYRVEWVNPLTGTIEKMKSIRHDGGDLKLDAPEFDVDVALRVKSEK